MTSTVEILTRRAGPRGSPRPRRAPPRRGQRSARQQQDPGLERPAPGRASRAAARPPRACPSRVRRTKRRGRRDRAGAGPRVPPREAGGEADVLLHRPLEQRRKLRHQADLAPQLERIALAHVGVLIAHCPRHGVGEPVQQPKQGRLAAPRRPGDAARPLWQRRRDVLEHDLRVPLDRHPLELEQHRVIITRTSAVPPLGEWAAHHASSDTSWLRREVHRVYHRVVRERARGLGAALVVAAGLGAGVVAGGGTAGGRPGTGADRVGSGGRISTIDSDGSNRVQLTGGPRPRSEGGDDYPVFSLDGARLAFVRVFNDGDTDVERGSI